MITNHLLTDRLGGIGKGSMSKLPLLGPQLDPSGKLAGLFGRGTISALGVQELIISFTNLEEMSGLLEEDPAMDQIHTMSMEYESYRREFCLASVTSDKPQPKVAVHAQKTFIFGSVE